MLVTCCMHVSSILHACVEHVACMRRACCMHVSNMLHACIKHVACVHVAFFKHACYCLPYVHACYHDC